MRDSFDPLEGLSQPRQLRGYQAAASLRYTAAVSEGTIAAGTVIGRYTIDKLLGSGSMGEVYAARDTTLRRKVALKLLHRKQLTRADLRERFKREARAVAAVSHPNVVQVFDIDEHDGRPYFVMEYLSGTDTQRLVDERGPLDPTTVAVIGLGAARGLAEAAAAGVVHRDIKPANLVITERKTVKVTDFGLAKGLRPLNTNADQLTMRGTTLGTPDYMSPEQARGDPVDARADIYGLGATLFHLLSGHPPYRANNEDVHYMKVIGRHITEPVPKLDSSTLPANLVDLVTRMMAKRRGARPSYDEIVATLRRTVRARRDTLNAESPVEIGAVDAEHEAELLGQNLSVPWRVRRPLLWTAIAALLLAAAAAVWLWANR